MMKRGRTALWACVLVLAAGMLTGGGCGGDRNGPADREAHKLLVIGIDSADWRILDPLLEQGRMPHLKEFMTQASSGRMKTFIPLQKSPVLWASICTGVEPEVHGIHNFVKGEDERPVTGSAWHAPALWDILTAADRSTAVMGMWRVTRSPRLRPQKSLSSAANSLTLTYSSWKVMCSIRSFSGSGTKCSAVLFLYLGRCRSTQL